jgi:hypothetical protein
MGLTRHRVLAPILVFVAVGGLTSAAISTSNPIPAEPPPDPGALVGDSGSHDTEPDAVGLDEEETASLIRDVDGADGRVNGPACTSPSQPLNFNTSWAGSQFRGLPLTAVIRECEPTASERLTRTNFVSYLYGSCEPDPDGCAVPIEIQTWPTDSRNHSMYHFQGVPSEHLLPHEDVVFHGVPALIADYRLELFYPDVTVVVFGNDSSERVEFARSLVPGVRVLTQLTTSGIRFEQECVDRFGHCEGIRSG